MKHLLLGTELVCELKIQTHIWKFEILFVLVLHIEGRGQGQNSSTKAVWDSLVCSSLTVRI